MAKRGRKPRGVSLDALMAELRSLDARRQEIANLVRAAVAGVSAALTPEGSSASAGTRKTAKATKKTGRRKGFKMSAEARAKIAAAQKARWAKAKKGRKSGSETISKA